MRLNLHGRRKRLPGKMDALGAKVEVMKESCAEISKEEKRRLKRSIYYNKKEVNEQFGRKMNQ